MSSWTESGLKINMEKEYILITDSTGFIGSHVVDKMFSKNSNYDISATAKEIQYMPAKTVIAPPAEPEA